MVSKTTCREFKSYCPCQIKKDTDGCPFLFSCGTTHRSFPTVVVKIVTDDFNEGFGKRRVFRNSSLTAYARTLALPTERHTGRSLRTQHKREGMEPRPYKFHTAYGNTGGMHKCIPYILFLSAFLNSVNRSDYGIGYNQTKTYC